MNALEEQVARVLRQEWPELASILEDGLRAGIPAEEILDNVRAAAGPHHYLTGIADCLLLQVDPDYRRRDLERQRSPGS